MSKVYVGIESTYDAVNGIPTSILVVGMIGVFSTREEIDKVFRKHINNTGMPAEYYDDEDDTAFIPVDENGKYAGDDSDYNNKCKFYMQFVKKEAEIDVEQQSIVEEP